MSEKRTWYVVFTDSDYPFWWACVLKPGFQHVLAFAQNWQDVVVIDPARRYLDVRKHFDREDPGNYFPAELLASVWAGLGMTVVKYEAEETIGCNQIGFGIKSCVSVIKYVIGLSSRAETPYQLYKTLLKKGGIVIHKPD